MITSAKAATDAAARVTQLLAQADFYSSKGDTGRAAELVDEALAIESPIPPELAELEARELAMMSADEASS